MTERYGRDTERTPDAFQIGPSRVSASGQSLQFDINERCTPLPHALHGKITVKYPYQNPNEYQLDHNGQHFWRPICTHIDVDVAFDDPGLSWRGKGYLDMNYGAEPITKGFDYWDWSRVPMADGATHIRYVTDPATGAQRALNLSIDQAGNISNGAETTNIDLPSTKIWRVKRRAGSLLGQAPRITSTMEDTPFYSRSLIEYDGITNGLGTHESLSCKRLKSPIVKAMLPFRMPRLKA